MVITPAHFSIGLVWEWFVSESITQESRTTQSPWQTMDQQKCSLLTGHNGSVGDIQLFCAKYDLGEFLKPGVIDLRLVLDYCIVQSIQIPHISCGSARHGAGIRYVKNPYGLDKPVVLKLCFLQSHFFKKKFEFAQGKQRQLSPLFISSLRVGRPKKGWSVSLDREH